MKLAMRLAPLRTQARVTNLRLWQNLKKIHTETRMKALSPSWDGHIDITIDLTSRNISHGQRVNDFQVGVVLDMDSTIGRVGWDCMEMALFDFYTTNADYRTRLSLHLRDSQGDNVKAALSVIDLLQNVEVQALIGPQKSSEADIVIDLGDKAHVPIISFSATSLSVSSRSPYFIRATQNDSAQVNAITSIIQAFKWREVVIVYDNSDYRNGITPYLIDALQEEQIRVPYKSVISVSATNDEIRLELYKLMSMQNRVFIVDMSDSLGSRLFLIAKEIGMVSEGYVWIITDRLTNLLESMDTTVVASMQGVLGIKPYINASLELDYFTNRWKKKFHQDLNIYGLRAYDTISTLAMAAERVGATKSLFEKPRTKINLTDITSIKTSGTGPELLDAISKTRFKGLSGDFYFINGELQSPVLQILNVIGNGEREIGFWTPEHGIPNDLNLPSHQMYSTSMANFRAIIWPGESVTVPKGWVIPTRGKKLRVGVPVKTGFNEIVKVERDMYTNKTTITGYAIDVFNLVMAALPYFVAYEFEPFMNANGSSSGNFTLPYTEGGISMMVALKDDSKKKTWIFLKPLSKDLWLTSGAFFILTGFVVWVLEHPINDDFRGSPSQQVGMIFWFPMSTLVFAHREKILSNFTRFVVGVWIFVVLILSSSYTASLSSMLTVQSLQPVVTSIEELKQNGDNVGCQQGSFVQDLLKQRGFNESNIKPFISPVEMIKALRKGSQNNGGISAFFGSVPYIKPFLAKNCNEYTMIGPINKTEGFGFAFPKGSPLVADVSRALLNVLDGTEMKKLDLALFGTETTCSDPKNTVVSNSMDLNSFRGLFIITGTVSGLALIVSLVIFICKHKHVWTTAASGSTVWTKIKTMLRQYDQKDLPSFRFRRAAIERQRSAEVGDIEASPSFTIISTYSYGNTSPVEGRISIDLDVVRMSSTALEELDDVRLSD
ncbi:hypothetical protein IFM89_004317 [Coptis chinensis]|uniref:Glutamate receptor n=1 Tax=Coptis chinensis TaxID=261450 RepID=A0A835I7X6_9MAGN|nr:hypothetical protein IFM89_004317 [Coptis chinensis]